MKINELKINSYGKLKDKNIAFKDGINIVYGENEKGKSTLLNCIVNMLYGTSKNKKGKDISDYDKYKPWDTEEFSGRINYSLDNGESYEVFREFGKKNPKIYNKNMEDISKQYAIDKSTGSQFFTEQTNVDEQTFTSTVVSYQSSVELDNQTQNILLQKIANVSSTGSENISYKKAIDKLNKKILDEIGTNRSQGKPMNIVVDEINRLNNEEKSLKQYENYQYEIEDKMHNVEDELDSLKYKSEFLTKLNNIMQEQNIESEKLKYSENKIDEVESRIQELIEERENTKQNLKNLRKYTKEKVNTVPYILTILVCIVISILLIISTKKMVSCIPLVIGVFLFIVMANKTNKAKKININNEKEYEQASIYNRNIEKKIYEINAQIELLEKNQQAQINEAECIKNESMKDLSKRKDSLKSIYYNKIDTSAMSRYIETENISQEIEKNTELMNERNMELHRLKLDKENILPQLEELAENEEKLSSYKEQYEELTKKNNAINMAKEIIEHAYQKMRNDVTPKFTENLSRNIAYITNNKYRNVVINEEDGILVELPNGEYKSANLLSKGTIEQLYLAFRLSIIEDISEETMPIIFDEIFAYADNNRLRETLKNIENNYSTKHQIILFTCTNREEEALKDLNINYNIINL